MGSKGTESCNMIVALTPTLKVSLRRVFDLAIDQMNSEATGFEAFDIMSGKLEKVMMLK